MMLDQRGRDAGKRLRGYASERAAETSFSELRRSDRRRRLLAVTLVASLAVVMVVSTVLLQGGDERSMVTEPPTTAIESAPTTSVPPVTTVPTNDATAVAPAGVVPSIDEGWEIVVSSRPGDAPLLAIDSVFPTSVGYYLAFSENDATDWYLRPRDGDDSTMVDVEVPATGFVTGGPGVVAWATIGPESSTEAQLWVSSDGIDFERVAGDLLAGCAGAPGCQGTEIYAAAASPTGRVVALAYDPLVWNPECDCFELNPVALVSDDGYQWVRQPLDLASVLPAEWQGAADIRKPLVYVNGRWLTYATHYYDDGYATDTAFFATDNGLDWELIDTGDLFKGTYLGGIAANDDGVVASTMQAVYWSADGNHWTRTILTDRDYLEEVAAYDDGYIAVSIPALDGAFLDTIWYSADGSTWSRMPLRLEEPTLWNTIVGDGPRLVAVGGTQTNLHAIWHWSK